MNSEIKELWIKALRSGEYKQGKYKLRSIDDRYCCLGVLSDLYIKQLNTSWIEANNQYFEIEDAFEVLPREVMDWAELPNENPQLYKSYSCAECNDVLGWNFGQIADEIDRVY